MKLTNEIEEMLADYQRHQKTKMDLTNGVLAVAFICIPVLTVSTVLWQWIG